LISTGSSFGSDARFQTVSVNQHQSDISSQQSGRTGHFVRHDSSLALAQPVSSANHRQRRADDHGPQPASRLCRGLSADPESRLAPHRGPRDRPTTMGRPRTAASVQALPRPLRGPRVPRCFTSWASRSADNDGPTTDRSQRPGSAAASPRTQSPALLHIVGLEIGRDGKFALMSTSSICDADRQPTPLPNVTGAHHKERVSRRRSDSGAVETAGSSPSSSLIGGRAAGAWCPGSNMRLRFPAAASNANLYSGLQRSHTAFCS